MLEQAETIEDEIIEEPEAELEETEELEIDDEEADIEPEAEEEEADEAEEEDDEVVVEIEGESPTSEEADREAPEWVKDLRKQHREQQRENRRLKKQLEEIQQPKQEQVKLGAKPTLEGADYDADVYESNLAAWYEAKRKHEEQQSRIEAEQRAQQEAWQGTLQGYAEKRQQLKVKDFEDAEVIVQDELSNTQQGMILQGADNPALVVYALGRNPQKAKELGAIKDPVKFAFAVAKLETTLKVTNRKATTKPETTLKGKAPKSGTVDSNLERLRAEAERTGDYTKVIRYKNQKRAAK
jgi:hypothetical protein